MMVKANPKAPQKHDAVVERWLREAVAPAYDAVGADPSRAVSASDVFAAVRRRHATMLSPSLPRR